MADETLAFDKTELRQLYKAFSVLGEEAKQEARQTSNALAQYLQGEIKQAGYARTNDPIPIRRIVDGSRVKKTSTTGEITFGSASQRFSGGANTKTLWPGYEFGSNKFKQFPRFSGRLGRGSKGYFIYPTLRANQAYIVREWTAAFNRILDKWGINGI
jgi:hypothetical protein